MKLKPKQKMSVLLALGCLIFILILSMSLVSADGLSGDYGYRSKEVVTKALNSHQEISKAKKQDIVNMLSNDGYFWFKTKQAKLNYIHANLPNLSALSIVADAEGIHSEKVKPLTKKDIPKKVSSQEYESLSNDLVKIQQKEDENRIGFFNRGIKKTSLQTLKGKEYRYIVINKVQFYLDQSKISPLLSINRYIAIKGIASDMDFLNNKLAKAPKKIPLPKIIVKNFSADSSGLFAAGTSDGVYPDGILTFSSVYTGVSKSVRQGATFHEYGHFVDSAYSSNTTRTKNKNNAYAALIALRNNKEYSEWKHQLGLDQYLAKDPEEMYAEFFKNYIAASPSSYNSQVKKTEKTISSITKALGMDKFEQTMNFRKFMWELFASDVYGPDSKYHPFSKKTLDRVYSDQEILKGSFIK